MARPPATMPQSSATRPQAGRAGRPPRTDPERDRNADADPGADRGGLGLGAPGECADGETDQGASDHHQHRGPANRPAPAHPVGDHGVERRAEHRRQQPDQRVQPEHPRPFVLVEQGSDRAEAETGEQPGGDAAHHRSGQHPAHGGCEHRQRGADHVQRGGHHEHPQRRNALQNRRRERQHQHRSHRTGGQRGAEQGEAVQVARQHRQYGAVGDALHGTGELGEQQGHQEPSAASVQHGRQPGVPTYGVMHRTSVRIMGGSRSRCRSPRGNRGADRRRWTTAPPATGGV